MPNIASFASLTNAESATSIGDLIARKPTTITIIRGGSAIASQVVRLETLASQRAVVGEGGVTFQCDSYLLGYRNNPSVSDTSLKVGDRFRADGRDFEIIQIMPAHVDCVQAWLVLRS